MRIQIFITGRGYHLGETYPDYLDLPDNATVGQALAALQDAGRKQLPPACIVTVGEKHLGSLAQFEDRQLHDGDELALVVPVAGG